MENFDARKYEPQFGGMGGHPPGMFDFMITDTCGKNTKDNAGGYLEVEMTSPVGKIQIRFNLFNQSQQAVQIANSQLAALCHVTGIFNLSFPRGPNGEMNNFARELRGGRGRMEIGYQKGQEPTPENPKGGYVEVKKLFDVNGNEAGKSGAAPQQMMPASQPVQPTLQPQQTSPNGGWNAPQQQQPAPQAQPNAGGWSHQPQAQGGPAAPPWGQR